MSTIHIEIDAYGPWIAIHLMDTNSLEAGQSRSVMDKAILTLLAIDSRSGTGYTNTLRFVLAFKQTPPDSATVKKVVEWLHRKLHRKSKEIALHINGQEVPVEKSAIQYLLEGSFRGLLFS